MNTIDVLAIGSHPDDVELNCGGTLLLARAAGLRTAICHLSAGEMGTRGDPATRRREARAAADRLGVGDLEILDLPDGHMTPDDASKDKLIRCIRRLRPRIVLAPYWEDLHPDHAASGALVRQVRFLAGLERWDTGQKPWRPEGLLFYMSHTPLKPSIVVDISDHFAAKKEAAACYRSQFHRPDSDERATFISGENFWSWWEGRALYWGHFIGVRYGEPFLVDGPIPSRDPFALFSGFGKYRNDDE
ncbi:MAG: bacillithiol biosynthesis deacetylase BshB1 [Planctomycetes bacterium]|nr:bacillithiol biosynthesis deacetylase BshB1 [Planctomycetota bacterium]